MKPPPESLWLVRHAQPLIGPGICYGQLDVPADAAHTLEVARALALALPKSVQIAHSPLQRCEQLVQALQGLRPDLTAIQADARLMEMHFGVWEGCAWNAIDPAALQAWTDDFASYLVGSGHGESVALFMRRVAAAFDEARLAAANPAKHAPSAIVWITHAGVIRAVNLLARGMTQITQASDWPVAAPGFGQWQVLPLCLN